MSLPIPYVWHVSGAVRLPDGVPFSQGTIKAFDIQSGLETQLGETGFDQSGNYTITYSSANFQKGDVNRTAPNLIVRVFDYQNRVLWQSSIIANASSEQKLDIVLGGDPVPETWKVSGTVTKADGSLLGSGAVVVGDSLAGQLFELGRSSLGGDGKFSVSYLKSSFQRGDTTRTSPNLVFAVQDAQGALLTTLELGRVATANETVAISIPHTPPVPKPTYSVFGSLTNRLGLPLSGKTLHVNCLDFQAGQGFKVIRLGTAYSDDRGNYRLAYDPALLPHPMQDPVTPDHSDNVAIYVDLEYQVADANGGLSWAYESSPLVVDASRQQRIDFLFDEESRVVPSEYRDLHSVLAKYLAALLDESRLHDDGTQWIESEKIAAFLSGPTRIRLVIDRESLQEQAVRAYFSAWRMAWELKSDFAQVGRNSTDDVEPLFGIARTGSASIRKEIFALTPDRIHEALSRALARGSVSVEVGIDAFLQTWRAIFQGTARYETDDDFGMYHLLVLALHGSLDPNTPPDSATKQRIESLLAINFDAAGDDQTFLKAVEPDPSSSTNLLGPEEWKDLVFLLDLDRFSSRNRDLVQAVFAFCKSTTDGPRSLAQLQNLGQPQWARIVASTSALYCARTGEPEGSLPSEIAGTTPAEQQAIFTRQLQSAILTRDPRTKVVTTLPQLVPADVSARWESVATFLSSDAGSSYDLDSSRLDVFLVENPQVVLGDQTKTDLRTLQRLYRLTTDVVAISYLLSRQPPLDSAQKIASEDEDRFIADHATGLGGMNNARQIHRLAAHYTAELSLKLAQYHSSLNLDGGSALAIPRGVTEEGGEASRCVANWTTLFGALNQQRVRQGQSILSPSAYLVDLLEYLRGPCLNLLLSRRPDILGLELTKANAETAIPTIDLAVELLEFLAVQSVPTAYQTTREANDLRAEPESRPDDPVVAGAYGNLAVATYPAMLPSNFPREEARLMLEKAGAEWGDLVDALGTGGRRRIVVDGPAKRVLDGTVDGWSLWGLDEWSNTLLCPDKSTWVENKTWTDTLSIPAIFLDRSGLTMQELLDLLATNTFARYGVTVRGNGLAYQEGDIYGLELTNISSEFGQVVQRFLRLKRFLGWSLEEMDAAWGLDLDQLDSIQDLHLATGRSVLEVLSWGQSMTDGLLREKFEPSYTDSELSLAFDDLLHHRVPTLDPDRFARWMCARMGYSRADLDSLLARLGVDPGNELWFRTHLESLHRFRTFASIQKLTVPDFLKLADWFGLAVDGTPWTWEDCRTFRERLATLDSSPIPRSTWMRLAWAPEAFEASAAESFLKSLGASLDTLRATFQVPDVDVPPTVDGVLAVLERCLAVLGSDGFDLLQNLSDEDVAIGADLETQANAWIEKLWSQGFLTEDGKTDALAGMKAATILGRLQPLREVLAETIAARSQDAIDSAIKTQILSKFSITEAICSRLLDGDLLAVGSTTDSAWKDWRNLKATGQQPVAVYFRMAKAALLANALESKESVDLEAWLPGAPSGVAFPAWNGFRCGDVAEGTSPMAWSDLLPLIQTTSVLGELGLASEGYQSLADKSVLQAKLDLRISDLDALLTECDLLSTATPPAIVLSDVGAWIRFTKLLALFRKTNAQPAILRAVVSPISDATGMAAYGASVASLRTSLMATMTPSAWREFIQPISDGLRSRKRDALAAYVCWRSQWDGSYPDRFFDSNDLYAHYLIDVQMEPDMSVSRILQALLSIQQFVMRGFMGLEGAFDLSEKQKLQWEWMKNYRVWEANRKVFLYPENWIEAELRDDKTPFFKSLEDGLLQADTGSDSRRPALAEYLQKLKEVSGLEIVGATREEGGPEGVQYTLHVVGRTRGTPHAYYYRKYLAKALYTGEWTPWEPIDADITAAIVFPALLNKRLYLAWPVYQQSMEQKNPGSGSDTSVGSTDSQSKLEIKMEWTHFDGKKWSGKKTSKSALFDYSGNPSDHQGRDGGGIGDDFHYQITEANSEHLKVMIFRTFDDFKDDTTESNVKVTSSSTVIQRKTVRTYTKTNQRITAFGTFEIWADGRDSCERVSLGNLWWFSDFLEKLPGLWSYDAFMEAWNESNFWVRNVAPMRCRLVHNNWIEIEEPVDTEGKEGALVHPKSTVVLNTTPGKFRMLPVNFSFYSGEDLPFFFMDGQSTYFVRKTADGRFKFELLSHPVVDEFHSRLRDRDRDGLFTRETQALPTAEGYFGAYSYGSPAYGSSSYGSYSYGARSYGGYYANVYLGYYIAGDRQAWDIGQNLFESRYLPESKTVAYPYPEPLVDFTWGGSNGIYNWELFFHVPMLLAGKLKQEQRYQEAMEWFHQVFDPRMDLSIYERGKRWAQSLPKGSRFWRFLPFFANRDADDSISETMGLPTTRNTSPDVAALESLVDKWKNDPFNPHLVARNRPAAYQKYVVMKYLDNLIAWADELFRTDTTESINEAVQLYVLAAEILGPRAPELPELVQMTPLTTYDVLSRNVDAMGNVLVELEDQLIATRPGERDSSQRGLSGQTGQLASMSSAMFYFPIPRNEKLLAYWDTVADRLYKIRNSLNIEGVKRLMALYAPPIDPGMLVRAKALGLDLGEVLSENSAPLPLYRFQVMLQKAVEITRDVQSLGGTLLSALEKKDAETLSLMRTANEEELLKLNRSVRNLQIEESQQQLEVLRKNRETVEAREQFYKNIEKISAGEIAHAALVGTADVLQVAASVAKMVAAGASLVPDFIVGGVINAFGGPQFGSNVGGGDKASKASANTAEALQLDAQVIQSVAGMIQIHAGYERRWADWKLQEKLANKELASIDKQILAAEIRISIAQKEISNIERQIEQVDEVYTFMRSRFSNQELYQWMATQLGLLHSAAFKLALDVAKRAERCYKFELGLDAAGDSSSIIQTGHWDGLHKGLLAGDRLLSDLRRLETSFLEKNRRELEITKPISLALLSPQALRKLQIDGSCNIEIPEVVYDLDFPGHYFRRIKAVRLEIPCTAGPYTSVSAKLTLLDSSLRAKPNTSDPLFANRVGIQSIATSQAQNDSGLFELNFRDDRYLPFEGAGAISRWRLELPKNFRQFDYGSIADVVLHISYTAREGGERLKKSVQEKMIESWEAYNGFTDMLGLVAEIRLDRDFNDNFQQLRSTGSTAFELNARHFPAFVEGSGAIQEIRLIAAPRPGQDIEGLKAAPVLVGADLSAAKSLPAANGANPTTVWECIVPGDPGLPGSWTIEADSTTLGKLPALGELTLQLRYFPTAKG